MNLPKLGFWMFTVATVANASFTDAQAADGLYLQPIHITSDGYLQSTVLDLMPYEQSRDLLRKVTDDPGTADNDGLELGLRPVLTFDSPTLNSMTFAEMVDVLRLNPSVPDPIPADVLAQTNPNDILLFIVDKVYDGEAYACCSENQASGLAQVYGNRFVYANGGVQAGFPDSFTDLVQTLWARVFVHELGHNSGLLHIGDQGETAANDPGNLLQALPSNDGEVDIFLEESQRVRMIDGLTNLGLIQEVAAADIPGMASIPSGFPADYRITTGSDANGPYFRYPVTAGQSYAIESSSDLQTWAGGTPFIADSAVYEYRPAQGEPTSFVRLIQQ